ncbi:MAG: DUF5915 domain-containing protein [Chitinophagales bacterium]|nr:DUF5915 domain-containing protein [Chitinophagales bacterium]
MRQPLTKILLPVLDPDFIHQVDSVRDLILSEVNVKDIEYITDTDGFIRKKAKANFKTLGRILGKHMKTGAQMIQEMDQASISQLEKTNAFSIEIEGESFNLTTEDVEISFDEIPGWQVATDREVTVALDVTLTEDLIAEGLARELVNRIQNIRKNSDFNVTDRIIVDIEKNNIILPAIEKFGDYIRQEVLANQININDNDGELTEITEEVSVKIAISKA